MTNQRFKRMLRAAFYLAALAVLIAGGCRPLNAQQNPNPPSDLHDPANQDRLNKTDMRQRESALRIKARTVRPLESNPQLALNQIQEDYQRIQVLNNEMRRVAVAKDAPDYKRLSTASAELKKRAARLKENLAFPEPEAAPEQKNQDGVPLADAVSALDNLIVGFVKNPLFQSATLRVDVQLATKATQDLNNIIELCANIKKSAEKLNKAKAVKD